MEYIYQNNVDDFRIKYSIISNNESNEKSEEELFYEELSSAYDEIDRLTNHADGYDYAIAVSCGLLSGIIDSIFVGEWDFARGKKKANIDVNNKITQFAKKQPDYNSYCKYALESSGGPRVSPKDPDRLNTAIEYLEWKFPLPGDAPWLKKGYDKDGNIISDMKIGPKTHHLDDLSHHPTIVGFIACIVSQYNMEGTYVNSDNQVIKIPFMIDDNGLIEGKTPVAKVGAGIVNWCFNVAKHRYGHLMSDIGGSKNTAGGGMGLPGTVVSLLKEMSCLPCFKDTDFSQKITNAYKNGIGTNKGQIDLGKFNCLFEGADSKVDYRTETAIKNELKRQAIPVAINEVIVRSFYFIRHFVEEMKDKKSIDNIDFKRIIPMNNRTIVRMITISSGVFTAVDLADAAIRSAVKSGGNMAAFSHNFILRVNFVGIGRFSLAVGADLLMGVRKGRMELAVACGEIANAALFTQKAIEEFEQIDSVTNDEIMELKEISKEISNLKF